MAPFAMKLLCAAAVPGALANMGLQQASRTREGEDLMTELADVVLANKQKVLPIPFEMILERDVGYVGEYPIMKNATSEAKVESLKTPREVQNGLPPVILVGSVYITGSDQPPAPPALYRMGGSVGGEEREHLNGVINPTSDLTVLGWQKIRARAVKEWLDKWNLRLGYPNKLVIIHSNGDVLYGGCEENVMKYKYDQIIAANGGTQSIVVGAEVAPYPSDIAWSYIASPSIGTRMTSALSTLGLQTTWASAYANCTGEANSICDTVPKYGYANAGFIMGPMSDVSKMLSGLAKYQGHENRLVHEYFIENQDKVALDFSGSLSMALHNMVKDGAVPVEVVTEGGSKFIKSKVTNQKVCFVQGNGNSFDALKVLAAELKA